ncbi:MAG: T9SS type A sorting domain-containing protein [candidate division WOR-3 bacterium]
MIQIVVIFITAISAPINTSNQIAFGAGGPDAYGYRWIDNDTVAPNAPTFNWIDISSVGTLVTGLGDDNVVGPFPIGFDFPYYWYKVNSFFVGSNGYIAFGDRTLAASPFTNLPNPNRPNNVVAPLMSDLDFSVGSPACYYWTNPAHDTCIITYQNVRWWNMATSNCSLQIILSKPDSSITFQYKRIIGSPYQGWSSTNNTTGIENITGTVGLSYLNGLVPSQNTLHDNLAVKFYPPDSSNYAVTDVGIWNAMNENSGGFFIYNNTPKTMWAKIKNTGNQPVANCSVFCRVRNAANAVVYSSAVLIPSMAVGQVDSVVFTPSWTPTTTGAYRTIFRTKLAGDIFPPNDSVIIETPVVTYPAELAFDNGVAGSASYWTGTGGGYGMKFIPPLYPCRITGAKAYLQYNATAVTCTIFVFKDDGPGGTPGTVLGRGNVYVSSSTPSWYQINLDATINSGAFIVGVVSSGYQTPSYCMDTAPPFSNQTWEYTGVWAPYREASETDVMIRALVSLGSGVEELMPVSVSPRTQITAYPNPFIDKVKIQLVNKIEPFNVIEIYNAVGEKINKLTSTTETFIWNGTDKFGQRLSPGIYFAKLKTTDAPILKLLITK